LHGTNAPDLSGWDSREGLDRPAEYSRAIIDQVLRDKKPLLTNRVSAPSQGRDRITAALCVPLVVFQKIRGVLYLDSTDPDAHFEHEQLEWLAAVGGIAVIVLEDLRRIEWLESENRRPRAEIAVTHEMVGAGPAIREMEKFIARVAPTKFDRSDPRRKRHRQGTGGARASSQ
jgi:transcriptional regulator with GAF, ATPase, and Fis domain